MSSSAEPIFFGDADRPLFGWLHRPAAQAVQPVGLVLCSPLGREAISSHRTYRHLAQMAAARGLPTLRFDYDGTGDSAGTDTDAERLEAWINSIVLAVQTLQSTCSVDHVCLFGVRLGATLAMLATARLPQVPALVAVDPVVNGKRYLRELRALAATGFAAAGSTDKERGLEEAAGFATTEATRTSMSGVDLGQIDSNYLTDALILERSDLQPDARLPAALGQHGVRVTREPWVGYAEMMLDPHDTVVPMRMLDTAVCWVLTLKPTPRPANDIPVLAVKPSLSVTVASDETLVRETAVYLDVERSMFAIVSEPDSSRPAHITQSKTVLLLVSSGATHHIGPNRLYVRIARTLAARGLTVIRMDLAGIGDSPPRPGEQENIVYTTGATEDIRQALDYARTRLQAQEIHSAGVCSGAYHSLKAAAAGLSLQSVIIINPLTYFWKEGQSLAQPSYLDMAEAMRYQQSSRQWSSWLKLLRGEVNLAFIGSIILRRVAKKGIHTWREVCRRLGLPLTDDLAAELQRIADLGIKLHFIFSATDPGLPMLLEQGGSSVPRLERKGKLQLETINDADHTFTPGLAQRALTRILTTHFATTVHHADDAAPRESP